MTKQNKHEPAPFEDYEDHFQGLEVVVENGNFEEAFRNFKAQVQKSKILSEYKDRQRYEKPSDKKRRKKREVLERVKHNRMREQMIASGEWEQKQKKRERQKAEKIKRQKEKANELLNG